MSEWEMDPELVKFYKEAKPYMVGATPKDTELYCLQKLTDLAQAEDSPQTKFKKADLLFGLIAQSYEDQNKLDLAHQYRRMTACLFERHIDPMVESIYYALTNLVMLAVKQGKPRIATRYLTYMMHHGHTRKDKWRGEQEIYFLILRLTDFDKEISRPILLSAISNFKAPPKENPISRERVLKQKILSRPGHRELFDQLYELNLAD